MAESLVKEVLGKLGSALWDEIGLLRSFKDDAKDLERQLEKIQAVLLDAEERSSAEIEETRTLRIWLRELKGAAYDIDDLLDEIRTQALLRKQPHEVQNENQLAKMVCDQLVKMVCDQFQSLMFNFEMAHRMKELSQKIDKIAKQRHDFGLVQAGPRRQTEMIFRRDDRETDSSVEKEKIVGRRDDIKEIVKLLLETNGHHDLSVIPIVGMGGLGKTTLAQVAFNDRRVMAQQVFDLRVWVYVSTDFDVKKIAEAVKSTTRGEGDLSTKESSNKFLLDTFSQKKFLLVLDDVWNEEQDKWEELKNKFKEGKKGSKILVTTRSEKVAEIMKTTEQPHRLEGLSHDDCWKLFKRRAFKEGEENDYPKLVEIGWQIVGKCGDVPLAANALGSMMRFKRRTEDAWSAIRDSEIWRLEEEEKTLSTEKKEKILPSLKLSYIQISSALKQCFAYCSIFPKGYIIEKDDLIQQWIALGFISSPETSSSMEDIGNDYFNNLLWMSFFQDVKETYRGRVTCRMHDLVHDLAQSVAREEVAVIVGENSTSNPEGCRYASIHSRSVQQVPTTVKQRLRALLFRESASLMTFYSEAKCLRLLDLNHSKSPMLPSSIGKLKLLRYLNLSGTNIKELPESITGLCNLQFLNLSFCQEIHTLSKSLGSLANLRVLNLSWCSPLLSLPSSLCQLKNLHDLNLSNLGDLQALPESIGNLENLRILNLSECSHLLLLPSSLCQLKNLHDLNLSNLGDLQALPESIGNLENLRILNLSECYRLLSLPSSLCQLKNLHDLNISNLHNLQALPESIGNLENLRILNLSMCYHLLSLPSSLCQLKNLHDLNLSNLHNLQALPESIGNLENLRILNLFNCYRLLSLPSSLCQLKNLHDLNLSNLGDLQALPESIGNLENLRILNLSECSRLLPLPSSLWQLKNLHDLNLSKLGDLQALPESIGNLENLRILNLFYCFNLLSLPSSLSDLQYLEKLDIRFCRQLCELPKMIQKLTKLRELLNNDCLELKGMPRGIGKLVSLSELFIFVVGKQNHVEHCASISELKQLNNLVGELEICGLKNVTNLADAKAANLIEKKYLQSLTLKWNVFSAAEDMDTVQSAEEMDVVLENLQPHQNLEKLEIEGYAGGKFPSWMMNRIDSCLPNLVKIELVNIPRCSSLPLLGLLPVLEELSIRNMSAITNFGIKFDGDSHINESANKFPALRRLDLSDMPTKLKYLNINGCGSLRYLPVHKMTTLEQLSIKDCPLLFNAGGDVRVNERPEPFLPSSVKKLDISGISKECLSLILKCPTMDSETPPNDGDIVSRQQPNMGLRRLTIEKCQQLTCLPEGLRSFMSLEHLYIWDCRDLERIEDWLEELTKLDSLNISNCQSLRYLPAHKMTTLRKLDIYCCPLLFNTDGQFVDTNVNHIRDVKVDGREYKHKIRVSNS